MAEHGLRDRTLTRVKWPEKLVTLVLLFILLTAAAAGVTSVLIGPDWGSLWRGLFFGMLFGWALAMLRLPTWLSALVTTALGAAYTLLFTGGLLSKISAVLVELAFTFNRFAVSHGYPHADLTPLGDLLNELFSGTGVILERVRIWIMALMTGDALFDPLAAALIWSIMVWLVAAWAGWIVEARRNPLLAVLPAVMLSLGTLSSGRQESFTIYVMLGATLLLLATVQHERREQDWDKSETAYPPRKGRQIGNAALILAVALVAISAIISSVSLPRVLEWVSARRQASPAQEGGLAKSLGIVALATSSPDPFEGVRHPGLPREKLIGSGPELSRIGVMTVVVDNYPAILAGVQAAPLYWRSFTYDEYTGHGWRSSSTSSSEHKADQPLGPEQGQDRLSIQQTMRFIDNKSDILYEAGEPVSVNKDSDTAYRSPGDLFGIQISSATAYQARSLIPIASESDLRAAGQRYPGWVSQRFLSLPDDLPLRVKDLAFKLTASEATPYDRAKAIERYLRTIPYTLDVPYPPLDQDLVDYFLFDLEKGYCDYYASAMVILARAAGVPARIAIGYATGAYNLNAKRFLVTEADAHTWVEVYFPNIGWVPFEPTAGKPPLDNTSNQGQSGTQGPSAGESETQVGGGKPLPEIWLLVLAGLGLIGTAALAWMVYDEIRLRSLSELAAAGEVYRRMRRYAKHLGTNMESGDTPLEFSASLTSRLQQLSAPLEVSDAHGTTLPFGQVERLTIRIVQTSYHPSPTKEAGKDPIYQQWRSLRWVLRQMWFKEVYQALGGRLKGRLAGIRNDKPENTVLEG